MNSVEIKEEVRKAYTKVLDNRNSGCCSTDCCTDDFMMEGDYGKIDGYVAEADYNLGCGIPTEFAGIKKGDIVLDLGSGAGNDVFIASKQTGDEGKVIGLDMTEAMINKANENKAKLGFSNVEFILGEIENIPLQNESVNVVLSNCVLNLVPDKQKAFDEIYRVLKPGGHFTVSDIVLCGELPSKIRAAAELYAGCISGALKKDDYIEKIRRSGFPEPKIFKEKKVPIPDSILLEYMTRDEIDDFRKDNFILSITLNGSKQRQ